MAKAVSTTTRITAPIAAVSCSTLLLWPAPASRTIAITGNSTFTSWFQTVNTTSASAALARSNPHPRSIANVVASPTASPPGATFAIAVDASETVSALRSDSPGSAAIHGGPKVTTFRIVTAARMPASPHVRADTMPQTAP
jgi:hypothetical protein